MSNHPDKVSNPINSPQTQAQKTLPEDQAQLQPPSPATEGVDKVITPTSIKDKEREADALQNKNAQVEESLRKRD